MSFDDVSRIDALVCPHSHFSTDGQNDALHARLAVIVVVLISVVLIIAVAAVVAVVLISVVLAIAVAVVVAGAVFGPSIIG